jgi:Mg-chelatase subunit ChlD
MNPSHFEQDPVVNYITEPNREFTVTNDIVEAKETTPLQTFVIAVLDTSGSMDFNASSKGIQTPEGQIMYKRIQLLKHAMLTVANMLQERDRTHLGIIGFSDSAQMLLPTGKINLAQAEGAINALHPGGGTNLWDGIRAGLEEASRVALENPHAFVNVVVLTDGEPTSSYSPPNGIAQTFENRMMKMPQNVFVHTFGFGYSLDTELLETICVKGRGQFGYCSDSSMVGTNFINFCANILSTVAINIDVNGKRIDSLQKGQKYFLQNDAIETTIHCLSKKPLHLDDVNQLKNYILSLEQTEFTQNLLIDIEDPEPHKGQLVKSVSQENYNSWGKNHLLLYRRALEKQLCVNFKEQSLKIFGEDLFNEICEKGNYIFANIPAPVPRGFTQKMLTTMNFSMTSFNTADGGCFVGSCLVDLMDGTKKRVEDCVKGDLLRNGSTILCIIKRKVYKETKMCVFPSGLIITPWHPIQTAVINEWKFPCYVKGNVDLVYVDYFYDFIVEGKEQWCSLNNFKVVTLGHGYINSEAVEHPYYGTNKVIEDMKLKPGWTSGFIEI